MLKGKVKQLSIFVFILILFSSIVSAVCPFSDNFNYVDEIGTKGWYGYSGIRYPTNNELLFTEAYGSLSRNSNINLTTGNFNFSISFKPALLPSTNAGMRMSIRTDALINIFYISNHSSYCNSPPCVTWKDNLWHRDVMSIVPGSWNKMGILYYYDNSTIYIYNTSGEVSYTNTTDMFDSAYRLDFGYTLGSSNLYLDNISCFDIESVEAEAEGEFCRLPGLFCDDFNYELPLSSRDWTVFDGGLSVDAEFHPDNNTLNLTDVSDIKLVRHSIDPFGVEYRISPDTVITTSFDSPVFSSEWDIKLLADGMTYSARDSTGLYSYLIRAFEESNGSVSWDYASNLNPLTYTSICSNCSMVNNTHSIKINTFFSSNNNTYNFNSTSTATSHFDFYIDGLLMDNTIGLLQNSRNNNQHEFSKNIDQAYIIDDYFVMKGTDKVIDSSGDYFSFIYDNSTGTAVGSTDVDTGELATNIDGMLNLFGLKTMLSRTLVSLGLMMLLAILYVGSLIAGKVDISAGSSLILVIIEFLFMILLTILKMMPIWIPFGIFIVGGGIGFLIAKNMMSSPG